MKLPYNSGEKDRMGRRMTMPDLGFSLGFPFTCRSQDSEK